MFVRRTDRTTSARQIAEMVGVSIATVSRALNSPQQVTPETRDRVLAAAAQVGYRPSPLGRNLVVGRSHLVGLIVPNIGFPLYGLMARSLEDVLEPLGLRALLASSDDDEDREIEAAHSLLRHAVDGGIVINSRANERLPSGPRFPWIHIAPEAAGMVGAVELDNRAGGRLAAVHLLQTGRRHLAHVAGFGREGQDRQAGWLEALHVAGIEPVGGTVGDYSEAAGRAGTRAIIERVGAGGLDGLFLAGDVMAAGAMRELREMGLRVPEDVAVIGFDDADFASFLEPPLTTVRQPARAMGEAAARLLLHSYNLESPEALVRQPILFEPELVVRGSSVAQLAQQQLAQQQSDFRKSKVKPS
jgi:DNA-binding LacI/PurR family transcriptional regulator